MRWSWVIAALTLPGCGWIFPMANQVGDAESYIHIVAKDGGCEMTKRTYVADRDKQIGTQGDPSTGLLKFESEGE